MCDGGGFCSGSQQTILHVGHWYVLVGSGSQNKNTRVGLVWWWYNNVGVVMCAGGGWWVAFNFHA